jgi:hypothetical protein
MERVEVLRHYYYEDANKDKPEITPEGFLVPREKFKFEWIEK